VKQFESNLIRNFLTKFQILLFFCVQARADVLRLEREEERRDEMRLGMIAARPALPLYANVADEEVKLKFFSPCVYI